MQTDWQNFSSPLPPPRRPGFRRPGPTFFTSLPFPLPPPLKPSPSGFMAIAVPGLIFPSQRNEKRRRNLRRQPFFLPSSFFFREVFIPLPRIFLFSPPLFPPPPLAKSLKKSARSGSVHHLFFSPPLSWKCFHRETPRPAFFVFFFSFFFFVKSTEVMSQGRSPAGSRGLFLFPLFFFLGIKENKKSSLHRHRPSLFFPFPPSGIE